jgi:signal transduction histidine kinase
MHKTSQILTNWRFHLVALVISFGFVALLVVSPLLFVQPTRGLSLGEDVPLQLLVDADGSLPIAQVAALPDSAFTTLNAPINRGYTPTVYWLKIVRPTVPVPLHDPLWLEITPTYLDHVTLYQYDGENWHPQASGDAAHPMQQILVRPFVFPLTKSETLFLRVQTTSAMHLYGTLWHSTELMAYLSSIEWASGAYMGIHLVLTLILCGAAMVLRMRSIAALALLSLVILVHSTNVRGYPRLWLPSEWAHWGDTWVSVGTFVLAAAFAWQGRELLTRATAWRRVDHFLLGLMALSLLAIASLPLGVYNHWAWVGLVVPCLVSILCAVVAWNNVREPGATVSDVLTALPYTLHAIVGAHVALAFTGLLPSNVEAGIVWQLEALLYNLLISLAIGSGLVQKFKANVDQKTQLLETLARSELVLEERVRSRTAELLQAQNALLTALHNEREMRLDQRHFFNMVNHEFRTPLAVVDSAATEQLSFPSPDTASQVERAKQIRRACRRLTALVENCLINERMDASGFAVHTENVALHQLIASAAQLVHWSPRHQLQVITDGAPTEWLCDPTLTQIALSNLVDNAVKYSKTGLITIQAVRNATGALALSVTDDGTGISVHTLQRIFEMFEQGHRTDQTQGFGLGLWVARRIAQLHGGDIQAQSTPGRQGTCFTLTIASQQIHA